MFFTQPDSKKICTLRIHLEMVRGPHLDNEENPSESGLKCVVTADECVVDGRGDINESAVATEY